MDDRAEYLSIAEAAALLGVHRNTIRNRIKAGRYKAHKVVTPQGETYAIERASLGPPPPNGYTPPLSSPVRDNPAQPSPPGPPALTDQQAQAEAVVQRLLAPFIAELGEVREELGRVKAERDAARAAEAEARRWAEIIGIERDQLRAAMGQDARDAAPAGTSEAQASGTATGAGGVLGPLRRLWRAIRGGQP